MLKNFPRKIVSVQIHVGPGYEALPSGYRWLTGISEIVVDDQQRAWTARCGMLCPIGAENAENFADPRTAYHAICIGENPDEVTSFGWYDAGGNLVEEVKDDDVLANPLLSCPPDRRAEFAAFLEARKGLDLAAAAKDCRGPGLNVTM